MEDEKLERIEEERVARGASVTWGYITKFLGYAAKGIIFVVKQIIGGKQNGGAAKQVSDTRPIQVPVGPDGGSPVHGDVASGGSSPTSQKP